nr:Retrovirus-related Pol polyprotein from transposon RE1 [Ipomoea batatas]
MALENTSSRPTTDEPPVIIPTTQDPQNSLLIINFSNITKLTDTNYLTWSLQITYILEGYDLYHHLDETYICPTATITTNGVTSPNLGYTKWKRQDRLIFSALLGVISTSLQLLIAFVTISLTAWQLLASTFAKPSHGHIRQLKEQLKCLTNGTKSVSAYMYAIKTRSDDVTLLGKPIDDEDLYKSVVDAINARDTTISFAELHEKLLNKEVFLQTVESSSQILPATANPTAFRNNNNSNRSNQRPANHFSPHDHRQPKPYLGRCQACGSQGHTAKRYPMYRLVTNQHSQLPRPQGSYGYRPSTPWKP